MKQLLQNIRDGKAMVVDVPVPAVRRGFALVRTAASLVSAGTERMIVEFAGKNLVIVGGGALARLKTLVRFGLGGTVGTGGSRYHTVQKKETLYSISRQYYGNPSKWKDIYAANRSEIGDPNKIRGEVLRKLNAAKGGGYIFQSDHSVSSSVSGPTYDYIVKLVRENGTYPIQLGEFEEQV